VTPLTSTLVSNHSVCATRAFTRTGAGDLRAARVTPACDSIVRAANTLASSSSDGPSATRITPASASIMRASNALAHSSASDLSAARAIPASASIVRASGALARATWTHRARATPSTTWRGRAGRKTSAAASSRPGRKTSAVRNDPDGAAAANRPPGMQRLRRRIQLPLNRQQVAPLSEHAIIRVQHAKIHTQVIRQGQRGEVASGHRRTHMLSHPLSKPLMKSGQPT
jgi:hypothetical protein